MALYNNVSQITTPGADDRNFITPVTVIKESLTAKQSGKCSTQLNARAYESTAQIPVRCSKYGVT